MPGSRKFTSNLHEIPNLLCVKTPGSCLENSSDFKHCFGLKVEATAENLSTTIRNLYLELLGISEQTLVTADLDPPRIWTPRSKSASGYGPGGSKSASGYGPGGPYPLADLDRGVQF